MSLAPCSSAVTMYKQHKGRSLASRDCCRSLNLDCSQFLSCSSRTGGLSGRGGRAGCLSPPQPAVSSPGIHADFPSSQPAASHVRTHPSGAARVRAHLTRLPFRRQPPAQGWEGCLSSSGQKAPKGADRGAELTPKLHNRLPPALCHTLRRCRNQLARGADGARAEAGGRGGWGLLQAAPFLPDRQSLEVARVATAVWNIPSAFQQPTPAKQL